MINWKIRFGSLKFWTFLIPAIALLIEKIFGLAGMVLELDPYVEQIVDIVETIFIILAGVGIVVDPTTDGIGDSLRALNYTEPYRDEAEDEDE